MPERMTGEQMREMLQRDCQQLLRDVGVRAWVGDSSVDEVQDLVLDANKGVIDVSKMEPVWVLPRRVKKDSS